MSHVVLLDLNIADIDLFFGSVVNDVYDVKTEPHRVWGRECVASFKLDSRASWRVGIQEDGSVVMESMDRRDRLMSAVGRYNEERTKATLKQRRGTKLWGRTETAEEVCLEFEVA